jgi:hypothetical protein
VCLNYPVNTSNVHNTEESWQVRAYARRGGLAVVQRFQEEGHRSSSRIWYNVQKWTSGSTK